MKIQDIIEKAAEYDCGDPRRIHHFMMVYGYASLIGIKEGLLPEEQEILEAAAVLHDIGIHNAEKFHSSSDGKYQELEGPEVAADILFGLGADEDFVTKVCAMIGRHHTYHGIDSDRLRILIEADFLVNIYDNTVTPEQISSIKEKIFRTSYGKKLLDLLYTEKYSI